MKTCNLCGKVGLKWQEVKGKWVLWDIEYHAEHSCEFKGSSHCKYCGRAIRWKEEFDTVKGFIWVKYDDSKNQEHFCKWKDIKHLPPENRPRWSM